MWRSDILAQDRVPRRISPVKAEGIGRVLSALPLFLDDSTLALVRQRGLSQPHRRAALPKVVLTLESPEKTPPDTPSEPPIGVPQEPPREPILTVPPALTAYVLLLAIIHLRVLLPPEWENWTVDVFGFIPKRYDTTLLDVTFPGGAGAKVWSFVTYSLLHANLTHIGFNVLWLLPFGSALARRFGALRFFLFMAVTARARFPAAILRVEIPRARAPIPRFALATSAVACDAPH